MEDRPPVAPVRRRWFTLLAAASAAGLLLLPRGDGPAVRFETVPYDWAPVPVGGGGWVTGLTTGQPDAVYARTDVGGAYRWDRDADQWRQLITADAVSFPSPADYEVEALSVAPSDEDVVYAAVGNSLDDREGRILVSADGGSSWTSSDQRFTIAGNAEWRQGGNRLAVHPGDPQDVLLGTRDEGLWRSSDGGRRWRQLGALPERVDQPDAEPAGVTFVQHAVSSRSDDSVWVGVEGVGVLRTDDDGGSWDLVHQTPGGVPRDADLSSDGQLYVVVSNVSDGLVRIDTASDAVKLIAPGGDLGVVAVDPEDPERVFVGSQGVRDGHLWRTEDGGESWTTLDVAIASDEARWPLQTDLDQYMSAGDLAFDPADNGSLWFAEGMGMWRSSDLDDGEVTWSFASSGIEELVSSDAVKPTGSPLLTAHWDRNVFRHPEGGAELPVTGRFNSAWSLDVARSDPTFVVAVVDDHRFCCDDDGLAGQSGFSEDGGGTWRRFESLENGTHPAGLQFGNITVAGPTDDDLVWVPSNGAAVHYSRDRGKTWSPADYPGSEPHFAYYLRRDVLTRDGVRDGTVYVLDADGVVRSTDGGATWVMRGSEGLPGRQARRFNATLAARPGTEGELLLTTGLLDEGSHGIFRSRDGGSTWTELPGLEDVGRLTYGAALAPELPPTVYATGSLSGVAGLWRSVDDGRTWQLLSEAPADRHQSIDVLAADPDDPGRVYVGFSGTGFTQGAPS